MNERLSLWQRLKLAGGVMKRGADALEDVPEGIMPPRRATAYDPLALSTVFRGVQVLQTAITGLPIHEMRNGLKLDTIGPTVEIEVIDIYRTHGRLKRGIDIGDRDAHGNGLGLVNLDCQLR